VEKTFEQIAFQESDAVSHAEPPGVRPRHGECRLRYVGRINLGLTKLTRQRQRNAPGAGAHIHYPKRAVFPVALAGGELEDALDNVLGLRPGNQNVRRDLEIQAPKFLMPGDVLSWLAGRALFDHADVALER